MVSPIDTFRVILKDSGFSLTRARLKVFEALLGQEPLSMQQLIEQTRGVDRASIYRTIALFERLDIVQRLSSGWKYRLELTDRFKPHHHHLTCIRCGRTVDMSETELEKLITSLSARYGFAPTAHQIEIQGICRMCRQARL